MRLLKAGAAVDEVDAAGADALTYATKAHNHDRPEAPARIDHQPTPAVPGKVCQGRQYKGVVCTL